MRDSELDTTIARLLFDGCVLEPLDLPIEGGPSTARLLNGPISLKAWQLTIQNLQVVVALPWSM